MRRIGSVLHDVVEEDEERLTSLHLNIHIDKPYCHQVLGRIRCGFVVSSVHRYSIMQSGSGGFWRIDWSCSTSSEVGFFTVIIAFGQVGKTDINF